MNANNNTHASSTTASSSNSNTNRMIGTQSSDVRSYYPHILPPTSSQLQNYTYSESISPVSVVNETQSLRPLIQYSLSQPQSYIKSPVRQLICKTKFVNDDYDYSGLLLPTLHDNNISSQYMPS